MTQPLTTEETARRIKDAEARIARHEVTLENAEGYWERENAIIAIDRLNALIRRLSTTA